MRPSTSAAAFAAANAAMVRGVDGASTVHVLLADCLELLGADTAGVLVHVGEQELELLAATSHKALELELYQVQVHSGPCVDTITRGESVEVSGEAELALSGRTSGGRCPVPGSDGPRLTHARHDRVLGGLNLFWAASKTLTQDEREPGPGLRRHLDARADAAARSRRPRRDRAEAPRRAPGAGGDRAGQGSARPHRQLEMDEAFVRLVRRQRRHARPLTPGRPRILDAIVRARQ